MSLTRVSTIIVVALAAALSSMADPGRDMSGLTADGAFSDVSSTSDGDDSGHPDAPAWRFITGGQIRSRPAVTADGTVYVLSEDRHIYAIREHSGELMWRRRLPGRVWDSLTVGPDGIVYTALKNGDVVAVNRSGYELWRYELRGQHLPAGDPVVTGSGSVVVGYASGKVISVSFRGELEWDLTLPAAVIGTPVVDAQGSVYLPVEDNQLYAVSVWGSVIWRSVLAGKPTTPAIMNDGSIVVGTDYGSVVVLDMNGSIRWDHIHQSGFLPPVVTEDAIFAVSVDGTVIRLSRDGRTQWAVRPAPSAVGYAAISEQGSVFFSDSRGILHMVSGNGTEVAFKPTVTRSGSFIASRSGRLVFGETDWLVYSYDWTPVHTNGWPQAGRDTVHSGRQPGYSPFARIEQIYGSDIDYIYLKTLSKSDSVDLKLRALRDIRERTVSGVSQESRPYVLYVLSELVAEGLTRTVVSKKRLLNDFPMVRREAALLLGKVGDFYSSELIAELARREYHEDVRTAMVAALGMLRTDRSGTATEAIAQLVLADARSAGGRNVHLVETAVESLASIYGYYGEMPSDAGYAAVFAVYRGDYPKSLRERALAILRYGKLG